MKGKWRIWGIIIKRTYMTDSCAWHSFRSRDSRVDFWKIYSQGARRVTNDYARIPTEILRHWRRLSSSRVSRGRIRWSTRASRFPHHRLARANQKAAFYVVPEPLTHSRSSYVIESHKVGIIGEREEARRKKRVYLTPATHRLFIAMSRVRVSVCGNTHRTLSLR